MSRMHCSTTVNAPIDTTFAAFTDFGQLAEKVSGITKVEMATEGPVGVGTSFKETRVMFGKESTETMEVTEYQPGMSYTLGANSCGVAWSTLTTFESKGDQTVVTLDTTMRPTTVMAKIMSPVMGVLFGRSMKKMIQRDIDELGAHVASK